MWESVKSVIPIPSELNFEEYATIDDQLQVTHLMSNSEIIHSIAKTNDDANNSRENNSDDEESPVSINEAYNSVQTLRKFLFRQKQNWSNNSFFALLGASYLCVELWRCAKSVGQSHQTDIHSRLDVGFCMLRRW
ncbi:hypothetical protein D917_06654 [Trichinella nativa]|uniref:Uncharacterized protein n=1 Tax=Trichinella nativa TaxID=6335 RepID=A0A1Y3ERK8_9BILA|nr:hypothetical protein D917_06654 [Trichinella nativa]